MNRAKWIMLAAVGVVAAAGLWQVALSPGARTRRYRAEITRDLRSPDVQTRKRAVWKVIERPDPLLEALIVQGVVSRESDADVREACVYALGKLGNPGNFAAIESTIDADPSGYVRAAAWLAAARCDPQHFRTLADTHRQPEQAWNQIGVAQGRLFLGDARDVGALLHWARSGDESQRQVASRALVKWLRPLLDAAGRWPLNATVREGQSWPAELVDQAARRGAALDLQAIADDTRRHRAAAARVRHNVMRLTRARERLVGLLFAQ